MKKDWTYKKLGEVCEILNGFAFKSREYVSDGIRVIRITNVQKGYVEDSEPKFYPISTQNELKRYLLFENDLLISLTGNVGRVGLIEKSLLPAYLNQRVGCLRIKKEDELTIPYLYYLLNSNRFENDCILSSRGAAQKNMSTVWLGDYIIPLPPLSEQSRIVSRLDAAFGEIEGLKAKAEAQLREARTLFQAALTQEMKPKQGWEEKKLGGIVKSNDVGIVKSLSEQSSSFDYPYIKMGNITNSNELDLFNITFVNASTEEIEKYKLEKNDFLFNTRNSKELVGKSCIFNVDGLYLYNNNILRIRFIEGIEPTFVNYMFSTELIKAQLEKIKKGTTNVWAIYYKELQNIQISLPSFETQQSIVSRLDALSEKVRELEEAQKKVIAECDALKQALLREVFE